MYPYVYEFNREPETKQLNLITPMTVSVRTKAGEQVIATWRSILGELIFEDAFLYPYVHECNREPEIRAVKPHHADDGVCQGESGRTGNRHMEEHPWLIIFEDAFFVSACMCM